jgi:hypothetical protein
MRRKRVARISAAAHLLSRRSKYNHDARSRLTFSTTGSDKVWPMMATGHGWSCVALLRFSYALRRRLAEKVSIEDWDGLWRLLM